MSCKVCGHGSGVSGGPWARQGESILYSSIATAIEGPISGKKGLVYVGRL